MMAGARLGRYELLARLATGGMGEIFLARLEGAAGFEKLCVIKRILPHLADDTRFRSMLIREAQIAASMSHANLCHVYELDESHRELYMVMEYLEGIPLIQLLQATSALGGQLELGLIAGIVQQASEGLHYAHELRDRSGAPLGLVHRDVTPSNLFLTESGVVKLVDFGIAKGKNTGHTDAGAIKGKYAYLAPEHLRGEPIDRRVDVFSLGVVVYEMVTCRRLYQRDTDYLTFRAVMEPPEIELREHRPDAPSELDAVLVRALARDPAERFATVRQLCTAVLDALGVVPWAQADISELVRTRFAEDLQERNAEISKVIRGSGRAPEQAIPVIGGSIPDASDDYFSFEASAGDPPAPDARFEHSRGRSEAFGQALSLDGRPAPPRPLTPASLPSPWRGNAAPAIAILGGAATVLVVGLVLIGSRASPRRVAPAAVGPAAVGLAAVARDGHAPRTARVRQRPGGPYGPAIRDRERELDQCARNHTGPLSSSATAVIRIGSDGRATQVALRPEEVGADALGRCIGSVLQTVVFPAAADDQELVLGLALVQDEADPR